MKRLASCIRPVPVLILMLAIVISGLAPEWPPGVADVWADGGKPRLTTATDSRIVFEIEIGDYTLEPSSRIVGAEKLTTRGLGSFSEPGMPRIPGRVYLVAIPPDASYTIRHSVVRSLPLGRHLLEPVPFPLVLEDENGETFVTEEYRIDAAVYNSGRSQIEVAAEPETRIRHQRVLPVRVVPVAYEPETGETVLATRIRVEISLRAPGGDRGLFSDSDLAPVTESPVWERIYKRILVNPDQAAPWRSKPKRSREMGMSGSFRANVTGPAVKISVRHTGIHRVAASRLIDNGLPAGTSVPDLHLFKRV
ncbi:MAG: hypothetical protein JSW50_02135, partial [Candidatus Latescibacterota bacterium]